MSIFGRIKDAILGHAHAAPAAPATTPVAQPSATTAAAAPAPAPVAPTPQQPVDVGPTLDAMVAKGGQPLNWRTSIVDLMKLIGMDSSIGTRHELADELGYTGDKSDSAAMNIWLHAKVMERLTGEGINAK